MVYRLVGSKWVLVAALLACACGGSADGEAGGSTPGGAQGGMGSGSSGRAGANGLAGSGSSGVGAGNNGGASNGSAECPAFTPCGGNLLGEWSIKQACISLAPNALSSLCPEAKLTLSPLTATGTVSFKADNTMVSSGVISFTESIQLPRSCSTEAQCTSVVTAAAADPTISNAKCDYDAIAGCSCSFTSTQPTMSSGTYEVQGNNVTFTSSAPNAQPAVNSFCVSGNTASLRQVNGTGSSSTLILTKQ